MKGNKEINISFWAAHATTIVSVTLVLLLVGVIAEITTAASAETRRLRERLELSAILADSVSDAQAAPTLSAVRKIRGVREARLITKAEALAAWKRDTGEDLNALFGVNPLSPEIAFSPDAAHAHPDSIAAIKKRVAAMAGVESVAAPDASMVEGMNRNISALSLILGCMAIVMLTVSFVLINNTVHLTVYSRRFTIHTMQLVGATDGFVRRPIVLQNMLAGVIAGVIASGTIAVGISLLPQTGAADFARLADWHTFGFVAAGLVVAGALICSLAAWIATARYLRKDYGELFK